MNSWNKIPLHIQHLRWERRVKKSSLVSRVFKTNNYFRKDNCIQFYNKKILLFDRNFVKPTTPLYFDYIIVSEKAKLDLENITCNKVIIDSSVPKYKWEQIKKECHKYDIPFYNVNTNGAYLIDITS